MAEAVKKEEEKKKGPLSKLKEAVDDKEEQLLILSTFVRLGVMIWAGAILTLNYVEIPGYKQEQKIDPTFIASVFTGVLASFGIQTASKKGDGTMKMNGNGGGANGGAPPVTAKDIEAIIAKAGPTQTIRVEQAPLKIVTVSDDKENYKL